jgi:hypothetical protein
MTKQPFTIEGSTPLKKALVEETRIRVYDGDTCNDWAYLICDADFSGLQGCDEPLAIHYQLPKDYERVVQALKEYFLEDPKFEKGEWYYTKVCESEYLLRFSHIAFENIYCDEQIFMENGRIEYSSERKSICNKNSLVADSMKPATIEQIQFMLGKVAEQKGYKPNVMIKGIDGIEYVLTEGYEPSYFPFSDTFNYCGYRVYQEGKWVEILPQQETIEDRELTQTRTYTIEEYTFNDGSVSMKRVNDGFTAFELLGLLGFVKDEILSQVKGYMTPDTVVRKVIKNDINSDEE